MKNFKKNSSVEKLKVFHISTNKVDGAGRYAWMIHKELDRMDHVESHFSTTLLTYGSKLLLLLHRIIGRLFSVIFLKDKKSYLFNFTRRIPGPLDFHQYQLKNYDLLVVWSLHRCISNKALQNIIKTYKGQIFIIPLDYEIISGGCHFSWDCNQLFEACTKCPQVKPLLHSRIRKEFAARLELLTLPNVTVLSCTRQMQSDVEEIFQLSLKRRSDTSYRPSLLYAPLGVNPARSKKVSKTIARKRLNLGLKEDDFIILLCAFNLSEIRKGGQLIKSFLCKVNEQLAISSEASVKVICLGRPLLGLDGLNKVSEGWNITVHSLGLINDDAKMNDIFRASSCLVSLSVSDVGPYIISEAISNNLPVVGFNVGILKSLSSDDISRPCPGDLGGLIKDLHRLQETFALTPPFTPSSTREYSKGLIEIYKAREKIRQ